MEIPWFVSHHFIREYRSQTILTVSAVATGVAVMVFLSALITGLQQNLISQTLGFQPHITVTPPQEAPRRQFAADTVLRRTQKSAQRTKSIRQWQRIVEQLRATSGVQAVAPIVLGSAFALRGSAHRPILLMGVDSAEFDEVIAISRNIKLGRAQLNGNEVAIGAQLAQDLGVSIGDKIRIQTPESRDALLLIRGIFDLGNQQANQRWVLTPLRAGQALLGLLGGVNEIQIRVHEIFNAETIAARISSQIDVESQSWMEKNRQLLVALKSQASSSYTIQFFVFVAVAMGIASVLVVSVVQRTREIGILRAMGMSRSDVFLVFLMQGAIIGLIGSILGCFGGAALSTLFVRLATGPAGEPLFPIVMSWQLFGLATILATITGILAAALPARIASGLDPVEAIRHA